MRPAQVLVLAFAAAILAGTALLLTPWAATGAPLSFVDALFTATSATCVTGLVVVDTATDLTGFGQGVVLALVQLGGLGIMTYSSLILVVLGQKLSFRGESLLVDTLGRKGAVSPRQLVRQVFVFTLGVELTGALLLTAAFSRTHPMAESLTLGVFHSISAFCNAGFSLFSDNLMGYRADPWVNGVVMALIVLGGLGFVVSADLTDATRRAAQGEKFRVQLHTKVVLSYSGALVILGGAAFYLFEVHNSLAALPWGERLLVSLFQAITPRTAGFNTLDYGTLRDATLFFTIILMFIGASPGSCGGGIKTTSLAVVVALFRNRMRGNPHVTLFHRTIPEEVVNRAISIFVVSFVLASALAFLLLVAEVVPQAHRGEQAVFLDLLFETVSAYGTVGLSTGMTAHLSGLGKTILVGAMFAGRLGPLTLAMAVGRTPRRHTRYAEEDIIVG
ncbi:MAG: TrkH family potassium uptake protein [Deferrisomatales bacterium]|nr:TrkH family potassium uptake protein [Deferrisomatales bacterium]